MPLLQGGYFPSTRATFDLLNYGDLSEQKCVPCLVEQMNADAADAQRKGGQGSKGGGRDTQVYLI